MNKKDKIFLKKKKSFNNNVLLFALLIIIVLFIVVFSAINFYDSHKRKVIEDDYNILQQQIILNDLYKKYLDESNSQRCTILKNQLDAYLNINSELYQRLKKINRNAVVESDDRTKLLFVLTNINLWLHYNSIEEECGYSKERAILYFYPEFQKFSVEKAESDAKTLFFAEKLGRLTNECNFNSIALPYVDYIPILDQIISDYNISSAPSVYINGKVYYDVNLDDDFLKEIGCR